MDISIIKTDKQVYPDSLTQFFDWVSEDCANDLQYHSRIYLYQNQMGKLWMCM